MECALVKYSILVLTILLQIRGHKSCFEEERTGLLEFKAFVKSNGPHVTDDLLPSWVEDRESDCCGWERVTCNTTTGHVMDLSLYSLNQVSVEVFLYVSYEGPLWFLNVSLLRPFKELQSLNLSSNGFSGWIENQGFERLSDLRKLEILDLGRNFFHYNTGHKKLHNDSILQSLGAITSLKTLILSENYFGGNLSFEELVALRNLEKLDLSSNYYEGFLPMQDSKGLSKSSKLKHLDLSRNNFDKEILRFLGAFSSLKFLSLERNWMEGALSNQELAMLSGLEVLILSNNRLNGTLPIQDSKDLSKSSKLKHLDLSWNSFNKEILRFLGAFSSLKFLSLKGNGMKGALSKQELAMLSGLEILILSYNRLNGTLPIQDLVTFGNLEVLDLGVNDFIGSIPPFISTLSSLKALSLSFNYLNGSLNGLCELKKLQELDLRYNNFDGILPWCLNNLTSLRYLDLSENHFRGNISLAALLINLTALEYIDLSPNSFKGSFSFSSFANHSKLEVFGFTSDSNEFEVEIEHSGWVPMFQLKALVLSNCNLKRLTEDTPNFLLNQHELRVLDLSHNNLKGRFPTWLLKNNTRLDFLSLRNNSFEGQFYLPPYTNTNTSWIDVSDNQFGGRLQENIGKLVPYIKHINLSRNTFEGSIPTSICEMSGLESLDLSHNNFSGEVPKQMVAGCNKYLGVLKLSNNGFRGPIFSEHFNMSWLSFLRLDNNQFTGTLSNVISKCSWLEVLDIGNNNLSGDIHSWVGNMTLLSTLVMRNNSFKGLFPCELIPPALEFLDLSHNSFSGSLPRCSKVQHLKYIHLRHNKFTGSIPRAFFNSSTLLTLDIGENLLSGSIPIVVDGVLSKLRVLVLRGNHLSGLIPHQLCQLKSIGLMDLSRNSFSGTVPHCFNTITFGNSDQFFGRRTGFDFSGPNYNYESLLGFYSEPINTWYPSDDLDEVEFVTKYRLSAYKGDILNYMSGLDLSCNKLTGEIPHELGNLSPIHALNLSHNQLTGSIPSTFSNLTNLESLDLSYNNLSGQIPSELIDLNFLEVFTVAHNNLSGRVPDMKAQFATFENSSYEGNPLLCGPPLEKVCTPVVESPRSPTLPSDESRGKWYEIDRVAFDASFAASYIIFLLAVVALLYINPHWRRRWFNFIEERFYSCYYFLSDTLYKLSATLRI